MSKSMEQVKKREQKELDRLLRMQAKPKPANYLMVLAVVVTLIHIVDETITQIGGSIQSNVIEEFFVQGMGLTYNEGLSKLSFLSIFNIAIMLITPLYKSLGDRWGRKPLLVTNVCGFVVGMLISFYSTNYIMYIVGMCIISFFVSHDMQVTYILESAPDDKRASFYGITKGIGTVGCIMLPILRMIFMGDDGTQWRKIFLVPAIVGIAIVLIVIFLARETDVFLEKRIALLKTPISERRRSSEKKTGENVTLVEGFRYMWHNKQLRALFIAGLCINFPTMAVTSYYQSIMHLSGMSDSQITTALFAYPLVFAGFNIVCGVLSDKIGRKPIVVASGVGFTACYILFLLACTMQWHPIVVGALYALYISFYWTSGDIRGVMSNESTPTSMRFTAGALGGIVVIFSIVIGLLISSICVKYIDVRIFTAVFAIPFMLLGTVIVAKNVKETMGTDLNAVE